MNGREIVINLMSLSKRISARLDVKGSRLIKGIRYEGLRVVGDLQEAALRYSSEGADELLYLDTVASLYGRNSLGEILRAISKEVFVPITAGGGVRSVDDAAYLLSSGADKIALNTAAIKNPKLISEVASNFGSQSVVVSIQARRLNSSKWEAMIEAGREPTGKDVLDWISEAQQAGAGEILLTSVDQDGTCLGPDKELIMQASSLVTVPLIVSGGFGECSDIYEFLKLSSISCVAIGAALHYEKLNISEIKSYLVKRNDPITMRVLPSSSVGASVIKLSDISPEIGIVDYGMGNQQSLVNAFNSIGAKPVVSSDLEVLTKVDILVLPGVGAFPEGMRQLKLRNLDSNITRMVTDGKPVIGICLGMQMLFESSSEFELTRGLGLLEGRVEQLPSFDINDKPLVLPHIGWNRIQLNHLNKFSEILHAETRFQYFVHSFAALVEDNTTTLFTTDYGGHEIVAASLYGNVCGFQFHPERSGRSGLQLLKDICNYFLGKSA
jgi:imidazole glycerol phosphate synthase glutamine amidotransferase subunit